MVFRIVSSKTLKNAIFPKILFSHEIADKIDAEEVFSTCLCLDKGTNMFNDVSIFG